nr:CdaR family protein [uncultured Blautia sp.]
MKKSLMNKSTLKILSLLIAILIWVVVKNVQDPMLVKVITRIPVTIVNESYLASNLEVPLLIEGQDTVNVKVKGRESVVKELKREDFTAIADMTQIISMETTPRMVPVKVSCEGLLDSDISVTPGNIQVDIEEQTSVEKIIAVNTGDTIPDKNYEVGVLKANPEKVTISGPESIVNKIDRVVALVDVSGQKETKIELDSELKIYDKNQDELSEKQLSYLDLKEIRNNKIKVTAEFWKAQNKISLKAESSGSPKYGYQVSEIKLVPDTISIAGTDEALQKLAEAGNSLEIPGSMIDVSGKSSDFDVNIDLTELLPENTKLARDLNSSVIVTVKILPYNSQDFELPATQIQTENIPEDMDLVFGQEKITVRLKGKDEDLKNLKPETVQMKINLKDYKEGEYTVPVTVTLPGGYELVDEIAVKVKLVAKEE